MRKMKFSIFIKKIMNSKLITKESAERIIARMQNGSTIDDAFYAEYGVDYKNKMVPVIGTKKG